MGQSESGQRLNRNTVPNFDMSRYEGIWYEIAHIDHLERSECQNATSDYRVAPDDTISVINYCTSPGKAPERFTGVGYVPDPNVPSKMKIDFKTSLGFSKLGDYWVVLTDYTSYALVSAGHADYLWILSRTPKMSICRYTWLVNEAKTFGYNTHQLKLDTNVLKECAANDPRIG